MINYSTNLMRRFLIVTEKHNPDKNYQDGGFLLVQTLKNNLGDAMEIIQFGNEIDDNNMYFKYPNTNPNRFVQRIDNADFIAEKVLNICHLYSDIIFVHISMLFGFENKKPKDIVFWTFPMFLTPCYIYSNESPPFKYTELESHALKLSDHIICPSHYERSQIVENYGISTNLIKVIPRGVNRNYFSYLYREIPSKLNIVFCSLGSIKRQKNTLGLVRIFARIRKDFPNAILKIIGPIQDKNYFKEVLSEIHALNMESDIIIMGHIPLTEMKKVLNDVHIHLSASTCETFGRAIYETLSCGIPNICNFFNNAAYDYLLNFPFVKFYTQEDEIPGFVQNILANYSSYSMMAAEIGSLFDETKLGELLVSAITSSENIIIADFDGTLFHKNDIAKTAMAIERFNQYSCRVICTSRAFEDIQKNIRQLSLKPDYIISWSGSLITDGEGNILDINGMEKTALIEIENIFLKDVYPIIFANQIIQYYTENEIQTKLSHHLRMEIYQNKIFISKWNCTKLSAIQKLLVISQKKGKILCFGDSKYDYEYLAFYDGYLMSNSKEHFPQLKFINEII